MQIEILYPEVCNLFGDTGNMRYLKKCLPDAEFVETKLLDEPLFAKAAPALIYMGSMSEKSQLRVIERLRPYRERLAELIDAGTCFLFTGNSMEVLGEYIEADGEKIEGLKILKICAKRDMKHRLNSIFLGTFEETEIVGFHSRFSTAKSEEQGFAKVVRGSGNAAGDAFEGVRRNNFFGTYLLGPILVLNPDFTLYLMKLMGAEGGLAFEETAREAYERRLAEFKDMKRKLD